MLGPMNKTMRAVAKRVTDGGDRFFDEGWMRFFDSRVESTAYRFNDRAETVLFITSERSGDEDRKYTVRVASTERAYEGNAYPVHTVGEFQGFDARFDAFDFIGTLMDGVSDHGMGWLWTRI